MKSKLFKHTIIYISISFILSFILSILIYKYITVLSMINTLFIIALLELCASALMMTARGGFFDAITHSFRTTYSKLTKKGELIKDEIAEMRMPSEMFSQTATFSLLTCSVILFTLSLIVGYSIAY
ncbi:DUF3899 domain-containing protein [Aquibacillus kalidii]|uniref:DUF3899 domain-containing protein n=1 Tax=Aquibacillus kalidii TaxID=2762597 RepID=UPI001648BB7F|nr:DUF3899 domain-containing protein [Aquibacillus kalidii]